MIGPILKVRWIKKPKRGPACPRCGQSYKHAADLPKYEKFSHEWVAITHLSPIGPMTEIVNEQCCFYPKEKEKK